jgi:hypothetical protein
MFGVQLVSKLRAILLMEADFNTMNKEVYGVRMLDNARQYKLIPDEIFSKQNHTANDGGLVKMLFYNIARQTRTPDASHPWTCLTVIIRLHTPWHLSSSNPLELKARQSPRCLKQFKRLNSFCKQRTGTRRRLQAPPSKLRRRDLVKATGPPCQSGVRLVL